MKRTQRCRSSVNPMKNIIDELIKRDDFLIISHVSPDGDTLGSVAALYMALEKMGKKVTAACDGSVPDKLRFLNGYCRYLRRDELEDRSYGCAVAVDVADALRLGKMQDIYSKAEFTMDVDHHPTNTCFGEVNYVAGKSSTGEIILEIIEALGVEVDERMANALYAAVSTDTGNFIYSGVTADTLNAAAKLRGYGADIPMLCGMIYAERSLGATKIIGIGIDRIELFFEGKVAALKIYKKDIEECGALKEDTECLINYAREIKGVEVAIFVNEQSGGKAKISLRSNEYVDVSAFAQSFGGGGHVHAAGYTDYGTVEEIYQRAVEKAGSLIKK